MVEIILLPEESAIKILTLCDGELKMFGTHI